MSVRIAINGLGRTGRCFIRSALAHGADLELVVVNDLTDRRLAHLLTFDSVQSHLPTIVAVIDDTIVSMTVRSERFGSLTFAS